jgi:anti-sigma regulatory factor (Ser/Thr protein kinase)
MIHTVPWVHEAVFPPESSSPSQARLFVSMQLSEHGLGHLADDLSVVVSELATNAVLHARTRFSVRLEGTGGGHVLLSVQDDGPPLPALVHAGSTSTSGRGLHLVDALSRGWGVRPLLGSGKEVWASFEVGSGR